MTGRYSRDNGKLIEIFDEIDYEEGSASSRSLAADSHQRDYHSEALPYSANQLQEASFPLQLLAQPPAFVGR